MDINPYKILGLSHNASEKEIKSAYRSLVKKHHPDKGVKESQILEINAAWEILGDKDNKAAFDRNNLYANYNNEDIKNRSYRNSEVTNFAKATHAESYAEDNALSTWIKYIYLPIDKLIGQVINPFPKQFRALSADPYDDDLMDSFCSYLEESQKKIKKVQEIFSSRAAPSTIKNFCLNLYHCISEVQDGLNELELYTTGYVDNYLHDGQEMLRQAKKKRLQLKEEKKHIPIG
tara:strand:- start:1486 stop:2184 length:699 start_codon:yes stop_codon:yes gene_type:complete